MSFKSLRGSCPICEGARRDCRESLSTGFVFCRHTEANPGGQWRYLKDDAHGFGVWAWGEGESADRPLRVTVIPPKAPIATLDPAARNKGYRALIDWAGLQPEHRAALAQRPHITEAEIANIASLLFSWQGGATAPENAAGLPGIVAGQLWPRVQGWAIAIPNASGEIIGAQIKNPQGGYFWASHADQSPVQLPNGELPLGVYGSPAAGVVNLGEGFFKPALSAARHGGVWIGAAGGHWASSPQQLRAALDALGCQQVVLNADSGAIANPHVMGAYSRLAALLESWSIPLSVRWWGQWEKAHGDVDEITPAQYQAAILFPWDEFQALATPAKIKRQRAKDIKVLRRQQTVARAIAILNQPLPQAHRETSGGFLPELPPLPPGIDGYAIDAGLGAGKTTAIGHDIVAPTRAAGGFTIELEPRNSLGQQAAEKHELVHIHEFATDKDSNQALGAMARDKGGLVLCPNSLPRAGQHIPQSTVVVVDEVMATLTEACTGGTLKGRYADTMGQLINQMRGSKELHIAESGLDQPTLDFVERVSGKRLAVIRHQGAIAPWDVHLATGGSPDQMFGQMMAQLRRGERVWLVSTSLDEATAWALWAKDNGIEGMLITGETNEAGAFDPFFSDPDSELERQQVQLLITTQSAQTGLSIERYWFDAIYGYAPGFPVEVIYQMLGRYRRPCPRYVWVPAFITPSRWEKPQKASALAEINHELSQWAAHGFAPASTCPEQAAIDDYLAARWERAWAQKVIPGQALTLMLERAGHTVIPWELAPDEVTQAIRATYRETLAQQRAQFHAGLAIDPTLHTPEWAKAKRDDAEATYRDRGILRKLSTLEKFPGIDWDNSEIWYQAWFAPRHYENGEQTHGPIGPGAALWAECGAADILQGKAADEVAVILAQRLRSISLLPDYGAKLAILAPMRPLCEQILASGHTSPGCPLIRRLGAMARAVGDDLYRYLRIVATDDHSDQAVAHKILRKFGLTLTRSTYRKVGRKRQWSYTVTAPPLWQALVEARATALDALQTKASSRVTDLLEEQFNKSVTAPPDQLGVSPDILDLADLITAARQAGATAFHQLRQAIKPVYADLWQAALAIAA
ncbi:hypothetical protein [Nodosilinea sp. E11]|uniref:hypothetical protein n=1 Tax=Nodosilinea sp. E11 TaxID=3037479 RepID=UPI0029341A74|nr:hypothetical protein [Nodosilinea sp. E11]WOD37345.1 hypothetical protein RRF56_02310 [Nodosilinea sp. E11]